jgi:hypothetical protein
MDTYVLNSPVKMHPIEVNDSSIFDISANKESRFAFLTGATPMSYENRQNQFSNSFRKKINNSLKKIAGLESPLPHTRHFSMIKQRSFNCETPVGNKNSLEKKLSRHVESRLRHPKIALSRKHNNKMRAFSINSELDDGISMFSREANDPNELNRDINFSRDRDYFKSNSIAESTRLDTPGFQTKANTGDNQLNNRQGTTDTRHTSSYTVSSNKSGESRLRFQRVNLNKISKNDRSFLANQEFIFGEPSHINSFDISNKSIDPISRIVNFKLKRPTKVINRHNRVNSDVSHFEPIILHHKRGVINQTNSMLRKH